jgi:choline kinase
MIKPLTFEEFWDRSYIGVTPGDPLYNLLKENIKITWNAAMREAKLTCLNTLGEYKESAFVDIDLVEDISKQIESLKSNN